MGYIVEVISKTILKFPLLKFRTKSKIQPFDTWAVLKRKLHIIVSHLTMCDWKCSTYLQWNPPGVGYKLTGQYQRLSFFKLKKKKKKKESKDYCCCCCCFCWWCCTCICIHLALEKSSTLTFNLLCFLPLITNKNSAAKRKIGLKLHLGHINLSLFLLFNTP